MKVMQIKDNFCTCDLTSQFPSLAYLKSIHPGLESQFVEAPDYVFPGWGYMDGQFIKPEPPEGWLYDDETGTFYPEEYEANRKEMRYQELCNSKIREKYSANDENKIVREYLANPTDETKKQAFDEYNAYVEESLAAARKEIYGDAE